MRNINVKPLTFVWWNTSLSHPGVPHNSPEDRAFIVNYICELFNNCSIDFLALGEISSQDLDDIINEMGNPYISTHDATHLDGKPHFDIGVLYDRRTLQFDSSRQLLESYGRTTLKIGEQIDMIVNETGDLLHFIISHWSSRMFDHESDPKRTELGSTLRRTVDALRNLNRNYPLIILMGDYNDDPCSQSLAYHLLATRDRDLAQKYPQYLYNPFWRCLGETEHYEFGKRNAGICGTYYYQSGQFTRWFTFDQFMFSSAFLGDTRLVLNEENTRIIRHPELEQRLYSSTSEIDHLPVSTVIEIRRV
jgi:hypothetical protein